ncbi:MAG: type II toxin-antitoxin system HipA family toxin [Salibacteraceae bacterium]
MKIERLQVRLNFGTRKVAVGELVQAGRGIYLKFYPEFLDTDLELSPIKLKQQEGIQSGDARLFEGLFGVFHDSLPDGWGRLLLDRHLSAIGQNPFDLGPLERLAFVGDQGLGALEYAPPLVAGKRSSEALELDTIAAEMVELQAGNSIELLDELYRLGGSSGGARPKIHVGYHPEREHLIYGPNPLPEGYEPWIIKFPSATDRADIAHIEYAYSLMARDVGLPMAECRLFEGQSGTCYFGTRRFDRQGQQRLHLHSASGLLHDDFRYSQLDYGHLMDAAFRLERDVRAYEGVLRLAAFNVFAHNRDDHSKNFSFLMDALGNWRMAPAYDLTFSSSGFGMHSTKVAGESRNPGRAHLLELAQVFGLKRPERILDEVQTGLEGWNNYAVVAGVGKEFKQLIARTIQQLSGR